MRGFCHQQGLRYQETGLLDTYAQGLRHLYAAGRTPLPDRLSADVTRPA